MAKVVVLNIQESSEELKRFYRSSPSHLRSRYKMLLFISAGTNKNEQLAHKIGTSLSSIIRWKKSYAIGGLSELTKAAKGGDHRSKIDAVSKLKIKEKISDPRDSFTSYKEAQEWINKEFGLDMKYHAINKYLKRNFNTKLKVGRKSHVKKDEAAIAVFKKPT